VALDKNLVRTCWVIVTFEEVIESDFVQRSTRCKAGDVTTNCYAWSLRSVNHDRCVPTHPGPIGPLNLFVAWKLGLIFWRDGVDVIGGWDKRNIQLQLV
jgi:hypothetical protein